MNLLFRSSYTMLIWKFGSGSMGKSRKWPRQLFVKKSSNWFLLRIFLNLTKGLPKTDLIMFPPLASGCRCRGKISALMILISSSPIGLKSSWSSCSSSWTSFIFSYCATTTTSIFFPSSSWTSFIFPCSSTSSCFLSSSSITFLCSYFFWQILLLLDKKKLL